MMEDLKERFNPEGSDLRKQQLILLDILVEIDRICKKYDIPYWLSYGTLLGAVRHKGFIPWDDDLDIEMELRHFKRFIRILPDELNARFVLQTHQTDKSYVAPYAKIRDTQSIVYENNNIDQNYKYRGIYVDVFPIEKVNRHCLKLSTYLHFVLYILSHKKYDRLGILKSVNSVYYQILMRVIYPIFRLFPKSFCAVTYGGALHEQRSLEKMYPVKKIIFEGKEFNAPDDVHDYLSGIYGDYMQIPSLDKIKTHMSDVKIFGLEN